MRPTVPASLLAAALLLLPIPAHAQGLDLGIVFQFDTLTFTFRPDGPEGSGDDGGSSLDIAADRVQVLDAEALDLRHCIDGQTDCSYSDSLKGFYQANRNRVVEPSEVANFSLLAPIGVAREPRIVNLTMLAQHNVRVDGVEGNKPRVDRVAITGAEGSIDSNAPVYMLIVLEITYDNNKKDKRHTIEVDDLDLTAQAFTYGQALWRHESVSAWHWPASKADPESARAFLTPNGWSSTQGEFESATKGPLQLTIEKGTGKNKAPGPELAFLLAALLPALALVRRRPE